MNNFQEQEIQSFNPSKQFCNLFLMQNRSNKSTKYLFIIYLSIFLYTFINFNAVAQDVDSIFTYTFTVVEGTATNIIENSCANQPCVINGTSGSYSSDCECIVCEEINAIEVNESETICAGDPFELTATLEASFNGAFNNYTVTSSTAGSCTVNAVNSSDITELMLMDDSLSNAIPIGFPFKFFGNVYSDVYFSANGFLSFNPSSQMPPSEDALPNSSQPNGHISLFADDLFNDTQMPGGYLVCLIQYYPLTINGQQCFVAEYMDVPRSDGELLVTGQIILCEDGTITINCMDCQSDANTDIAIQGIENVDGTDAYFDPAYPGGIIDEAAPISNCVTFTPNYELQSCNFEGWVTDMMDIENTIISTDEIATVKPISTTTYYAVADCDEVHCIDAVTVTVEDCCPGRDCAGECNGMANTGSSCITSAGAAGYYSDNCMCIDCDAITAVEVNEDATICTGDPFDLTATLEPSINGAFIDYTVTPSSNPDECTVTAVNSTDVVELFLMNDSTSNTVPIGFPFKFFGDTYNEVYFSANGFLSFNPAAQSPPSEDAIPNSSQPNGHISLFADDLFPEEEITVVLPCIIQYYPLIQNGQQCFVAEYLDVPRSDGELLISGQIILCEDGSITVNCMDCQSDANTDIAIQGIENVDGTVAYFDPAFPNGVIDVVAPFSNYVTFTPNYEQSSCTFAGWATDMMDVANTLVSPNENATVNPTSTTTYYAVADCDGIDCIDAVTVTVEDCCNASVVTNSFNSIIPTFVCSPVNSVDICVEVINGDAAEVTVNVNGTVQTGITGNQVICVNMPVNDNTTCDVIEEVYNISAICSNGEVLLSEPDRTLDIYPAYEVNVSPNGDCSTATVTYLTLDGTFCREDLSYTCSPLVTNPQPGGYGVSTTFYQACDPLISIEPEVCGIIDCLGNCNGSEVPGTPCTDTNGNSSIIATDCSCPVATCEDNTACNVGLAGACTYPNAGFDCNGECTLIVDCNNVCGGNAVEDCAGVCNGSADAGTGCTDASGVEGTYDENCICVSNCVGNTNLFTEEFSGTLGQFSFESGPFSSSKPTYEYLFEGNNNYTELAVGGTNNADIYDMSVGIGTNFTTTQTSTININLIYEMILQSPYESDEFSEVRVLLNGNYISNDANDYLSQIYGDGNGGDLQRTGLQNTTLSINDLPAGNHTLTVGLFVNQKTYFNEYTNLIIDRISVEETCPGAAVTDSDGDGEPDNSDNCVNISNPDQLDNDQDGIGDECDETDGNCTLGDACTDDEKPCLVDGNGTLDENCECVGPEIDNDNDGICAELDDDDTDECIPNPCNGNNCVIINSEDFEAGLGIWNRGGGDCSRFNNETFANSGMRGVRIRDNSGRFSSLFSNVLDLSGYNSVDVSFSYLPLSMEPGENFLLEVSGNGGNSYTKVKSWISGSEFTNGTREDVVETINTNLTSNTRIRIRCDASSNGDRVYIDDIVLQNCENPDRVDASNFNKQAINLYPNPASDKINIDISQAIDIGSMDKIEVNIFTIEGKMVYNEQLPLNEVLKLNINHLQNNLQYLVVLRSEDERVFTTKFLKIE